MTLHDQGQDVSERERVPMGGCVCMGVCVCWEKEYVQCDQMDTLFLQYLDISSNENLPNSKNISQIRFKSLPITEWILKIYQNV